MKSAIQILRLGLAPLLVAATSPVLLAAPPHTGIQGQAVLYVSYGTPTLVEAEPGVWYGIGVGDVELPVVSTFNILSARSHRQIGHFTTDADGRFTVPLPPGKYLVVPDDLTLGGFPFGQTVSTGSFEVAVRSKQFSYALILYYHDGPFDIISATGDRP